jgi:hypothetical protein
MLERLRKFTSSHSTFSIALVSFVISAGLSHCFSFGFSNRFFLFFLVAIAVYYLIDNFCKSHNRQKSFFALIFSLPLTISFLIGDKIVYTTTDFLGFSIFDIPKYLCLLALIFLLANFLLSLSVFKDFAKIKPFKSIKHPFWFAFCAMIICWLPYWLAFMPGIISVDTIVQFKQAIDPSQLSNWHPILHTLLLGIPVKIGYSLGNLTAGITIAVLMQELVTAAILARVAINLAKIQKRAIFYYVPVIFFALCPVVALYAVTPWKDIIFSSLFLLLVVLVYGALKNGKNTSLDLKNSWKILLLLFLVPFFRNGGVLILLSVIILFAIYFKNQRIKVLSCGAAVAILVMLIQGPGYKLLHVQSSPFMESMSVPAQQIAYVARNNELRPEDLEELDYFADVDLLVGSYSPMHADAAKTSFNYGLVEEDKGRFLKLWAKLLSYNFGSYVKAYIYHIYSYWYIGEPTWVDDYTNVHRGEWVTEWDYSDINIFGEKYRYYASLVLRALPRTSWFGAITNVGALVWGYIFMFIAALYKKRKSVALAIIPIFVYICSLLIASPVSWIFRYVYILLLALPVFFCLVFCEPKKKQK